jgi:precorrin-6A/cobalt-precorrin-6A reductase
MTARILLLAGTAEARALAKRLHGNPAMIVTASLAGVTSAPAAIAAETRRGGFGGASGLAEYVTANAITAVIDATHPYAAQMATNAALACTATGTPRLRLIRPPWQPAPGWRVFPDIAAAAAALPPGANALLTTGRKETAPFATRADIRCILRSIEPAADLPAHIIQLTARPPFTLEDETTLMHENAITHLISKNAGGPGRAKLDAAAALGIPVYMVDRPAQPPGALANSIDEAVAWLRESVGFGS